MVARDYKRSRASRDPLPGWAGFALGLALGLAVGLSFWYLDPRAPAADGPAAEGVAPAPENEPPPDDYDYPSMFQEHEVQVPEREVPLRGGAPAAPIDRPGTYTVQAGSYRSFGDADRVRAQLALQGIESRVQPVTVGNDTLHRVRIGPIADLAELNRIRARLREAEIEFYVFEVRE